MGQFQSWILVLSIVNLCIISSVVVLGVNMHWGYAGLFCGMGLPSLLAWPLGGQLAGVADWVVGNITLGLRTEYLAIATLGISEIIVAMLKYESI